MKDVDREEDDGTLANVRYEPMAHERLLPPSHCLSIMKSFNGTSI